MTIKISQLGNLTAVLGNVLIPTVANVAGTLTTVKANINQIADHIVGSGNYVYGNVIPSANVTYNLGSPAAQWKDLYLSGSTIYIGGATLSVANGAVQSSLPIVADISANTLTVADTQLTFSQGSYIDETEVAGQPGVYGLALNSPDDGIVGMNALDANASVTSSVIVSNISVQVNVQNTSDPANVHVWQYLEDGSLVWPDSEVQSTAFSQTYIDQMNNTDANVAVLQGNVVTLEDDISNLQANAAVQAGEIAAVAANISASSYGDSNVASYLETYTGNISASTISTNGLEIGGNYTFTSNGPNLAVRQALVANVTSQLEWVDYFGRKEFDALIVTYIPNYPGNANSFVSTPTRVEAREYVTATESIFAPNVFAANLTSIDSFYTGNIRFFNNTGTITGNLIPSANVTYSLGSETAQWKDLWVANSTIYIGGVAVSTEEGNLVIDSFDVPNAYVGNLWVGGSAGSGSAAPIYIDNDNVWQSFFNRTTNNAVLTIGDSGAHIDTVIYGNLMIGGGGNYSTVVIAGTFSNNQSYDGNVYPALNVTADISSNSATTGAVIVAGGVGIGGNLNVGGDIGFVMANSQHWTSNVSTISDALNQLAERIYNIENP